MADNRAPFFDETFLRKLEQLSLVARRIRQGQFRGEKRSLRRGQSVEFADYRNYTRGDDLRALDWNIYARLERPFIKLFEEEIDQSVHILLDASASMAFPPALAAQNKWHYARRLAASLGYIALANHDRLHLGTLSAGEVRLWGPERHRQAFARMLDFLEAESAQGETHLGTALTRYARRVKRAGLLFIVSDLLSDENYRDGLTALQQRGHEISLLHILSPDEVSPVLAGDFQLRDSETDATQDVTANATLHKLYRQHFEVWQREISQFCAKRNINYIFITTDTPFEQIILQHLRKRGWLR